LAIDYGSDFIKASLMKPGMPFDVLLNKDSKRKIRSSVGWKNGERLFGQDAFNIVRCQTLDKVLFFLTGFTTGHALPKGLVQLPEVPPRRPCERRRRSLLLQLRRSCPRAIYAVHGGHPEG
jgi:hypothetical protein